MREAKWSSCANPQPLLRFLKRKVSNRKLQLFACACCRRIRGAQRGKNLQVLEAAEEFADGVISRNEMEERRGRWYSFDYPFPLDGTWQAALCCATMTHTASHAVRASGQPERHQQAQTVLLRDIIGNPFHPVALDHAWKTPTVLALTQAAYDNRTLPAGTLEPTRLSVLADALEEAGCDNADILNHLRDTGVHVRGCWVVDLLLGKESLLRGVFHA